MDELVWIIISGIGILFSPLAFWIAKQLHKAEDSLHPDPDSLEYIDPSDESSNRNKFNGYLIALILLGTSLVIFCMSIHKIITS